VEGLSPGKAMADLAGVPAWALAPAGWHMGPDELPDGLVVADHAGRVAVFNRAAARLTGIPAADVLGADVRQALPLRDADGRCWWMSADPYQGLPTRTRHPEMSLYLPEGTELLVTVGYVRGSSCGPAGIPCPSGPGPLQHLVISLRGAQQRARLERGRADLVSTVAHELRSPLTSVKGFTATLLAKWTRFTDDQKRVMLETVNADADRVTRLITELLDVSRIESGRMEVHRQFVSIPERVEKIVAGRVAAGEPAERFQVVVTGELPETWLDADKVDQILGNLVENAIRHGAGTVTVVVEPVETVATRGTSHTGAAVGAPSGPGSLRGPFVAGVPAVAVSVRDEGDGVAPELVPRIFRQFWRAKRRGGAGLGLYIVKGLVEAHGGTITVQRAPGGGAEFRFTMPASLPDFG
jgi:signal transduction histidine kinase